VSVNQYGLRRINQELENLTAERAYLQEQLKPLNDRWVETHEEAEELWNRWTDLHTDDEFLSDEALLLMLVEQAFSSRKPADRLRKLTGAISSNIKSSSIDSRDEFYGYPIPGLMLTYKKPGTTAQDIRAWAIRFGLGRTDMPISVLDRHCGEYGSWEVWYVMATDTLKANIRTYGHSENQFEGSLDEGIEYLAEHVWYEGGPEAYRSLDY
jgi:hypothetical protein